MQHRQRPVFTDYLATASLQATIEAAVLLSSCRLSFHHCESVSNKYAPIPSDKKNNNIMAMHPVVVVICSSMTTRDYK